MKEGLLDKIKSRSYWRVNFKPNAVPGNELTLPEADDIVRRSCVSLRGWDYPHVSNRNDASSGYGPAGQYYEHWIDWDQHIEFWRMFRSTQFLHYRALWEDWVEWTPHHTGSPPTEGAVSVVGTIFLFTEIFEFLFRLARNGLYSSGVTVAISLEEAEHRHLWINEFDRMPFIEPKVTLATVVTVNSSFDAKALAGATHESSRQAIQEFFQNFDWSPSADLIASDQKKLLTRSF